MIVEKGKFPSEGNQHNLIAGMSNEQKIAQDICGYR